LSSLTSDTSRARLTWANLGAANVMATELCWVDLLRADLRDAGMGFTYLTGTKVTAQQHGQAASLEGATMPDGTQHISEHEPEPTPTETGTDDTEGQPDQAAGLDTGKGVEGSTCSSLQDRNLALGGFGAKIAA
jgi:hypothetical protein